MNDQERETLNKKVDVEIAILADNDRIWNFIRSALRKHNGNSYRKWILVPQGNERPSVAVLEEAQ